MKHSIKVLAAILAIAAISTACAAKPDSSSSQLSSSTSVSQPAEENPAEKTVKAAMDAIQKADTETLKTLVVFEDAHAAEEYEVYAKLLENPLPEEGKEALQSLAKHISYAIDSAEITGDTATVKMTITNLDGVGMVTDLLAKAITNPAIAKDQKEVLAFVDAYTESIEFPVSLDLHQHDGTWVINGNADYLNALSGGILESDYAKMLKSGIFLN